MVFSFHDHLFSIDGSLCWIKAWFLLVPVCEQNREERSGQGFPRQCFSTGESHCLNRSLLIKSDTGKTDSYPGRQVPPRESWELKNILRNPYCWLTGTARNVRVIAFEQPMYSVLSLSLLSSVSLSFPSPLSLPPPLPSPFNFQHIPYIVAGEGN